MHRIAIEIDKKEPELKGLEEFVDNARCKKSLTVTEAYNNIRDGLVDILLEKEYLNPTDGLIYVKGKQSKGLLITNNGYILTCEHCIEGDGWNTILKTLDGIYGLEKICFSDQKHDVALIKAEIKGYDCSKEYIINKDFDDETLKTRFYELIKNRDEPIGQSIKKYEDHYVLKNQRQIKRDNGVIDVVMDQILFLGQAYPGDSGSPIISTNGELIGIVTTGHNRGLTYTATPIDIISNLITKYIEEEKKKHI